MYSQHWTNHHDLYTTTPGNAKKVFRQAFKCAQFPKAGLNTQHTPILKLTLTCLVLSCFRATQSNVEEAIRYVESLEARGGTNINDALLAGISIIQVMKKEW